MLRAMEELGNLKGSEAHSTIILTDEDKNVLRKLGINVTFGPILPIRSFVLAIKLKPSPFLRGFLCFNSTLYDIMKEEN